MAEGVGGGELMVLHDIPFRPRDRALRTKQPSPEREIPVADRVARWGKWVLLTD